MEWNLLEHQSFEDVLNSIDASRCEAEEAAADEWDEIRHRGPFVTAEKGLTARSVAFKGGRAGLLKEIQEARKNGYEVLYIEGDVSVGHSPSDFENDLQMTALPWSILVWERVSLGHEVTTATADAMAKALVLEDSVLSAREQLRHSLRDQEVSWERINQALSEYDERIDDMLEGRVSDRAMRAAGDPDQFYVLNVPWFEASGERKRVVSPARIMEVYERLEPAACLRRPIRFLESVLLMLEEE